MLRNSSCSASRRPCARRAAPRAAFDWCPPAGQPRCHIRRPRMAPERRAQPARTPPAAGRLDVTLDTHPLAPARARTAIRGWSEHMTLEPVRRDALELLVSETVANAVQHASAPDGARI